MCVMTCGLPRKKYLVPSPRLSHMRRWTRRLKLPTTQFMVWQGTLSVKIRIIYDKQPLASGLAGLQSAAHQGIFPRHLVVSNNLALAANGATMESKSISNRKQ